jgi:hypothetical protein
VKKLTIFIKNLLIDASLQSFGSFGQAVSVNSEEKIFYKLTNQKQELPMSGGHCGRDRIAVGFTTMCAISAYHH